MLGRHQRARRRREWSWHQGTNLQRRRRQARWRVSCQHDNLWGAALPNDRRSAVRGLRGQLEDGRLFNFSDTDIRAQRFDATGVKVGGEFLVNSTSVGGQIVPESTGLTGGGFVVTWVAGDNNRDIRARVYDQNGQPIGPEFTVSAAPASFIGLATVAALGSGGFVVSWATAGDGSVPYGVVARIFAANGTASTGVFLVSDDPPSSQYDSRVAALPGGGFVVVWEDRGSGLNMVAQAFDASGARVGNAIPVGAFAD